MTREERLKHAKEFVNARCKEAGVRATGRLSKGYPGPLVCTITKSLERVGVHSTGSDGDDRLVLWGRSCDGAMRRRVFRDPEMVQFTRDFDAGLYPDLLIKPKPIKAAGKKWQPTYSGLEEIV